jgi:hypothetical protein
MKKLAVILCVLLAGCAPFVLGKYTPLSGQTRDQAKADSYMCGEKAKVETETPERIAGSFAAGLTIIGAPVAMDLNRQKAREVYADCMTALGYKVEVPK